jgi:hypothetical protein
VRRNQMQQRRTAKKRGSLHDDLYRGNVALGFQPTHMFTNTTGSDVC